MFATAEDWVDSNCTDSQLYVDFMLTRVRNVQACGVTPIMVFDGKRNNLKVNFDCVIRKQFAVSNGADVFAV